MDNIIVQQSEKFDHIEFSSFIEKVKIINATDDILIRGSKETLMNIAPAFIGNIGSSNRVSGDYFAIVDGIELYFIDDTEENTLYVVPKEENENTILGRYELM